MGTRELLPRTELQMVVGDGETANEGEHLQLPPPATLAPRVPLPGEMRGTEQLPAPDCD